MPTDEKINFVYRTIEDKYFLVLRQFKNDKDIDNRTIALSPKVAKLVSWIMASPLNKTDSLLVNRKLLPMNRDILGRTLFPGIMLKWAGKASRVGDWRSAKANSFPGNATLQERQLLASKTCHSVSAQMTHCQRVDQNAVIMKEA